MRSSQRGVAEEKRSQAGAGQDPGWSRAGAGPESDWSRAGVGLESGWSRAGVGPESGWSRAGVGLELSAPQEASGSSQRPVARRSPRKSRPGGCGQALLRAPPSDSPAPFRGPGGGRRGGGEAVQALSATALACSQEGLGKDVGSLQWPRPEPHSPGFWKKKKGERGKGEKEQNQGHKVAQLQLKDPEHKRHSALTSPLGCQQGTEWLIKTSWDCLSWGAF